MSLWTNAKKSWLALVLCMPLAACGGSSGDDDGGDDDGGGGDCYQNPTDPACIDPAGTDSQYVADTVTLPATASQAQQLGLDLDGDPQNRPDNALGQILSTLAAQSDGPGLQESVDEGVATGELIMLLNLRATSTSTATKAGLWVLLGENPTPAACASPDDMVCGNHLTGTATFDISADSPPDAALAGQIVGGKFTGGPGQVKLQLSIGEGDPLDLNLIGAKVDVTVGPDGLMSGKVGGAIEDSDLQNNVLPGIVDLLSGSVTEDCPNTAPPCCTEGSTGETVIDLFDENDDCMITLEELKESDLISSLLAPDVDLLDENGDYNPRVDGVKDSLSLGIGFTGTGASFPAP